MAANPRWWKMSKLELRLHRRHLARLDTFRSTARQGTAPLPPVIVPPELIWEKA